MVLVIEDRAPGPALESQVAVITEATRTMFGVGRCHVSVFPTMELIGDLVAACELGVEIVDEPLEEHASRLDGSYSLVVIAGSNNYQQFARTARQLAPSALIVYDDGLLKSAAAETEPLPGSLTNDPNQFDHDAELIRLRGIDCWGRRLHPLFLDERLRALACTIWVLRRDWQGTDSQPGSSR